MAAQPVTAAQPCIPDLYWSDPGRVAITALSRRGAADRLRRDWGRRELRDDRRALPDDRPRLSAGGHGPGLSHRHRRTPARRDLWRVVAKLEKPCNPAVAPVGGLRWRPPQSVVSWACVRLLVRAASLSRRQCVDLYRRGLWEGADGYACIVRGE
jgi:hypothetical protein